MEEETEKVSGPATVRTRTAVGAAVVTAAAAAAIAAAAAKKNNKVDESVAAVAAMFSFTREILGDD